MAVPGEFDLIARYFAPLSEGCAGALGLTDDAAILAPESGTDLVVTTDALVEGVHFLPEDPADLIARKALRVNLSDLAAMGARPVGYTLALALSDRVDEAWLEAFADGLRADQEEYGVTLVGGDTVKTPGPATLSITAFGAVPSGKAVQRCGAQPGDALFVSGTVGDAGAGLAILQGRAEAPADDADFLVGRYRLPAPRTRLGPALVDLASAAIDVSDGVLADLGHICDTSVCGAEIRLDAVPISDAARRCSVFDSALALGAGDDYELLFTAPEASIARVDALAGELDLRITRIGRINDGGGIRVLDAQGRQTTIEGTGFRHF